MNNLGQRIKELRKKNDLTQEKLADYLGVTYQSVSKWETGVTMPDLALIMPLARLLHVTTDELLGGKSEETDARRTEYDKRCEFSWNYNVEENYRIALQAVSEYPGDYKYLTWLALMESCVAANQKRKEDPALPSSSELIERSIFHNNRVIEECKESEIRETAIWNTMITYVENDRREEALKCAQLFPDKRRVTRNEALKLCLQGEEKITHQQNMSLDALRKFCLSLSDIYYFAEKREAHAMAALDIEEAVLKTVFPDGNYGSFHGNLYCAYEKRAEFELFDGNYDKAVEYLCVMMDHAKKVYGLEVVRYTCGVFDRISARLSKQYLPIPYIKIGKNDIAKPFLEQIKDSLMKDDLYASLRDREDFKKLFI